MTPEQASKLRKGDRIFVEAVVVSVHPIDTAQPVRVAFSETSERGFWPPPKYIREVLPRPLEAGDRVKGNWVGSLLGQVIAIDGDSAWVRWADDDRDVHLLSDLQRVEDQ